MNSDRLRVGFIGSGFMTHFHLQSFRGVRSADVLGIWSPTRANAESAARMAQDLGLGSCRAYPSLAELACSPEIDAIWICGPNHKRVDHVTELTDLVKSGRANLLGLCCEKPLARNIAEARKMLELVRETGVLHGYLENQVFTPALVRGRDVIWRRGAAIAGRPYLARTAEEHSGPHNPWFWQGNLQGGGVLNDMLCHSVEAGRFLLTDPTKTADSLRLKSISAQIACLKWNRPDYADALRRSMPGVDYETRPAEDFARATLNFEDDGGHVVILEASTSWSYVGPGLRLTFEMLGPEYALTINSLQTSCNVYFSRRIQGEAGEDLVEKQNAEQGLLPVLDDEPAYYGYEAENRHMVDRILAREAPAETWEDGVRVVETLMTCYHSAETQKTVPFSPDQLVDYRPQVALGTWSPRGQ